MSDFSFNMYFFSKKITNQATFHRLIKNGVSSASTANVLRSLLKIYTDLVTKENKTFLLTVGNVYQKDWTRFVSIPDVADAGILKISNSIISTHPLRIILLKIIMRALMFRETLIKAIIRLIIFILWANTEIHCRSLFEIGKARRGRAG